MKGHDELRGQIADFCRGTLDADAAAAVERHLSDCESCRDAAWSYEAILAAVSDRSNLAGHPDAELIVGWSEKELAPSVAAAVERHVSDCDACTAAVEALASSGPTHIAKPPRPPSSSWGQWAPMLAAAGLSAIVVGAAMWSLQRDPSIAMHHMPIVRSTERAADGAVRVVRGGPVAVVASLPEGASDATPLTVEIRREGRGVESRRSTVGRWRELMGDGRVVVVTLPRLNVGRFELSVHVEGIDDPLVQATIEVIDE